MNMNDSFLFLMFVVLIGISFIKITQIEEKVDIIYENLLQETYKNSK